jgi:hypothetical protein
MPLRAFINDEEVLAPFISDTDWQVLKNQKFSIVLPCCRQSGFFRVSKLGTKHFVHKTKTGCSGVYSAGEFSDTLRTDVGTGDSTL